MLTLQRSDCSSTNSDNAHKNGQTQSEIQNKNLIPTCIAEVIDNNEEEKEDFNASYSDTSLDVELCLT